MLAHARHLAARGHTVRVFTSKLTFPSGVSYELPDEEIREGFSIRRLRVLIRKLPFFQYPSNGGLVISGFGQALLDFQPEVIHAHNIGASAWAHLSAKYAIRHEIPFFYSPHHHPNHRRLNWLRKLVDRNLNRLPIETAARIFHLTSRDYDVFLSEYPFAPINRFAVLRNGVDITSVVRSKRNSGDVRILFVGRVDDPRKGFAILEAAVERLFRDGRVSVRLTVVGRIDDKSRERLKERFRDAIDIRGFVDEDELECVYANTDIFVMPSLYEGFGMPYLEAMRFGVPVIGSNVGGIPEVVPPGTGILTRPGDVTAVADALRVLVDDPELRRSFGDTGKAWSKGFEWDRIVDELESDYEAGRSEQVRSK